MHFRVREHCCNACNIKSEEDQFFVFAMRHEGVMSAE